jgi:hypothetical protein
MPEPMGWLCWTGTRIGDGPPAFCTYEPPAHSIRERVVLLRDIRTYGDAREAAGYAAGVAAGGKDAERYRALRRGQKWSVINGIGDSLRADELDAVIDAALRGEVK